MPATRSRRDTRVATRSRSAVRGRHRGEGTRPPSARYQDHRGVPRAGLGRGRSLGHVRSRALAGRHRGSQRTPVVHQVLRPELECRFRFRDSTRGITSPPTHAVATTAADAAPRGLGDPPAASHKRPTRAVYRITRNRVAIRPQAPMAISLGCLPEWWPPQVQQSRQRQKPSHPAVWIVDGTKK